MMNDDDASTSMMCVPSRVESSRVAGFLFASFPRLLLATSLAGCVDLFMRPQLLQQWQKMIAHFCRMRAAQRCRLASQLETNYAQSATQLSKCQSVAGAGARGCMEQGVTRLSTPWGARHRLAALCDVSITYAPCGLPQNAKG